MITNLNHGYGKTKVPKEFIVLAEASCLVSLLFLAGVASLSSLVGFIYPAFKSFQAIETKTRATTRSGWSTGSFFAFSPSSRFYRHSSLLDPLYYAFKLAFCFGQCSLRPRVPSSCMMPPERLF
jgi:hypothetical protein